MNKEEKIGMYTRNEIFEHLCENSDIGMLGRSMYDAVMSKIDNLQSQLDIANKKLDKIKKHCNLSTTYEFNEIKNNHNSFDHQRIINNNNEILSIIGGKDDK